MKKETINDRVRILRKALGMTQQDFADKLKFKTGNTLSMIERGENTVSEQHILLICTSNQLQDEKTVNPDWLRTGQGEMFVEATIFPLDERLEKLKSDERELIELFDKLYPNNQLKVIEYAQEKLDLQELREQTSHGEKGEDKADTTRKIG